MVTFTKDEIYTATEVVRNFSSVLSRVGASELKRAVIVKNNKFEAVLLNMEAVSVLESIYAAKKRENDGE